MRTFLQETIEDILLRHKDLSSLMIVLPSKRAGGFFRHYLRQQLQSATFLPRIVSIEEFVETLADLEIITGQKLLLYSYQAYQKTPEIPEKDDFETYSGWIQPLLGDLNEMDRYLVDSKAFFDYLLSIKTLEKWNVTDQPGELIQKYLSFWKGLPEFYENLKALLSGDGLGYQGMVYRKACEELEHYLLSDRTTPHIFVGFNALNKAEQFLFNELLENGRCQIYWDADASFFNDPPHSASHFMRQYFKTWKNYRLDPPPLDSNFEKPKHWRIVESQSNVLQAKCAAEILSRMSDQELNKTAVVLGDEQLLIPLVHSLPENIGEVNITMGVPLSDFPQPALFRSLLYLHQKGKAGFYYKDIFAVLQHSLCQRLLPSARRIIKEAVENNMAYLTHDFILNCCTAEESDKVGLLFGDWGDSAPKALGKSRELMAQLKASGPYSKVEQVVLYQVHLMLEDLSSALAEHSYVKSLKSLLALFEDATRNASVDFKGDAYKGLQIMGVLETRALDFEQIIMLSVNEGTLPSGKSSASFLTYDLKKQFGLPMYDEKDAVYSYHFYRLLQRASSGWFLYNGLAEGLSTGEKSRFLLQLETTPHPNHKLTYLIDQPTLRLEQFEPVQVQKTPQAIEKLHQWCDYGISPSALTSYVRNPLDFYYRYVLRVDQDELLEEVVEYATLGTIVHNSLEKLYKPLEGLLLTLNNLNTLLEQVDRQVTLEFEQVYKKGDYRKGKNLLIYEVAKRYVHNLVSMDLNRLASGESIELVAVERVIKLQASLPGIPQPITFKGTVDRMERLGDTIRVVDYKTGAVSRSQLNIVDWDDLTQDYAYSKAFQVLMYAYLISPETSDHKLEAGIISFKNMANGFMPFGIKKSRNARNTSTPVDRDILEAFEQVLARLLSQILDAETPFEEKEV